MAEPEGLGSTMAGDDAPHNFSAKLQTAENCLLRAQIQVLKSAMQSLQPGNVPEQFDQKGFVQQCALVAQTVADMQKTNTSLNKKLKKDKAKYTHTLAAHEKKHSELSAENANLTASLLRATEIASERDDAAPHAQKLHATQAALEKLHLTVKELHWRLDAKTVECDAYQQHLDRPSQPDQAAPDARPVFEPEAGIQNQLLSGQFQDFFRVLQEGAPCSAANTEEFLYDQFLLDHPERDTPSPRQYTRDEVAQAMDAECGSRRSFESRKRQMEAQHGAGVRVCKKSFARCLAALGGKRKRVKGVSHWTNIGMHRRPHFWWSA